jgi:putative glycosyltransferase (TIGR04372 family)
MPKRMKVGCMIPFYKFISKIPSRTLLVLRQFNYVWALPMLLVIRLIRPFILIRFTTLNSARIGHFAGDSCYYLATLPNAAQRPRTFHWFAHHSFSCNKQWSKMVARKLFLKDWVKYLCFLNSKIPGGTPHVIPPLAGSRPIDGIFQKDVQRFEFLPSENAEAMAWMERRGWKPGEPFVSLLVRDPAYLQRQPDFAKFGYDKSRWNYHNYRDSDIDTYASAIDYLVEKGYWVVRIGQYAEKPLKNTGPRVIDYPFSGDQNDLMDIWLTINCSLFMCTGSGLDCIVAAYNKAPTLFVNAMPLSKMCSWQEALWTPKNMLWKSTGIPLSLREQLANGYGTSHEYESAGVSLVDLTEEQILQATTEQVDRINGTWKDEKSDQEWHPKFWAIFREMPDFHRYHGWVHPKTKIGTHYLRALGDEFLK